MRRVDLWVRVFLKLPSHKLEGIYCLRQLSLLRVEADTGSQGVLIGELAPLFLFPALPYYLTLFKHYMAQQRVDRAISYPPELVFLLTY